MVFYIMTNLSTNDILRMTVIEKGKKNYLLEIKYVFYIFFSFFFFYKNAYLFKVIKARFFI